MISTRGLKPDAIHYYEMVFDVNSAYFDNHGGYEFAKQFYEDAYKAPSKSLVVSNISSRQSCTPMRSTVP